MKFLFLAILMFAGFAQAKIKTETITYKQGDTVLKGFLAYDAGLKDPRPGILVVHEWMGLDEYAKRRATELAEKGYVAFAADIYGKGQTAKNMKEAAEYATKYKKDRTLFRARVNAGFDVLKSQKNVNVDHLAAIGFCFGGTGVLELARSGADVKGIVVFHGGLSTDTPADAKNIKAKVLVLNGAVDPNVKPDEVAAFYKEMDDAKVDYQFVNYSGTVHAFTNPKAGNDPSKGAAYNAVSERRSMQAMATFLDEVLK